MPDLFVGMGARRRTPTDPASAGNVSVVGVPRQYPGWNPELAGEGEHLGFVEVSERQQMTGAIAVIHEEALLDLNFVGCSEHDEIACLGDAVGHHHAKALLHVGLTDEAAVVAASQAVSHLAVVGIKDDQRVDRKAMFGELAAEHKLESPAMCRVVVRHVLPDDAIASGVAATGIEDRGDVDELDRDAQGSAQLVGELLRQWIRIAVGKVDGSSRCQGQQPDGQRCNGRAVDAAADGDDATVGAALRDFCADGVDEGGWVDHVVRRHGRWASCEWRARSGW